MIGNVAEWCEDTWTGRYDEASPRPGDGLRESKHLRVRVARGGYFAGVAQISRSAFRLQMRAENPAPALGTRFVLALRLRP